MSSVRLFGVRAIARAVVVSLVLGCTSVVAVFVGAGGASASHFRAGEFNWSRSSATSPTVTFTLTQSYRLDFPWTIRARAAGNTGTNPGVGDVIDGSFTITFGTTPASTSAFYIKVSSVDASNDLLTGEMVLPVANVNAGPLTKTYPTLGSYTASFTNCCRLGSPTDRPPAGHINNPDGEWNLSTLVNLAGPDLTGVTSSLPPIIDCPKASACNFSIPSVAPAGDTISYRLATSAEAAGPGGSFVQPSGAAVSGDGQYTWNTTGKTLATAPLDTYYSTQVIATASRGGVAQSTAAIDFFLRITNQNNNPPVWSSTTPPDGTTLQAVAGQPVTITVGATDPDATDVVTLAVHNAPATSTFTTTPAHSATGTFTWTPDAIGNSAPINFTATDQNGLDAVRSVTIVTSKAAPTLTWPSPAPVVYGTALSSSQLDAALSTAAGVFTPPNPGSFTYTPGIGAVLDAGADTLSVTWNPDPADADLWAPVTMTQTLQVNKAPQTLSFQPPVDDSVTHTYGDPDFPVTAVSTSGLPVIYSVGAGDACTQTPQPDGSTSIHFTDAGSCTLSVDQPGNGDYLPAATLSHSFTAAKRTPALTLAPATLTYGDQLGAGQLSVTSDPADALDHGQVSYLVDGSPATSGTVLGAGQHVLEADFTAGVGSDYNSTSATTMFTVLQATQKITFGVIGNLTFGAAPFPAPASADSGNAVAVISATPTVCVVTAAGLVSIQHAGLCILDANQAGDSNYKPADQVENSFTVAKAPQAIDFPALPDLTFGDPEFTPQATGGASEQPVTFASNTLGVCSTDNTGEVTIESAGDCTIVASQAGNDDYLAAGDVTRTFTVHRATPTLAWSTPSDIDYGTALDNTQLDATVAGLTGSFTYTLDSTDGGGDAAAAVLSPGDHTLHVTFQPDDPTDYTDASSTVTVHVRKAAQTLYWTNVPTSATYGDAPFTVEASGGESGNPINYAVTAGSACTVAGSTVTITAAGPCVITADQSGNADYLDATEIQQSVTVGKRTPTVAWPIPGHITYGTALGQAQLNATVSPDEAATAGDLSYTVDATTADATGQVLNAGTHTLHVAYTPHPSGVGANYTGATMDATLVVDQASQAITFANPGNATYGDPSINLTATGGGSGQPVTFTAASGSACTTDGTNGATLTFAAAGTCTVTAHQLGTANYAPADDVTRTLQVNVAPQTITFTGPSSAQVGDRPITLSATGGGSGNPVTFTAGPSLTCTTTTAGVLTLTGPGTCTVTASQAASANYAAAPPVSRSFAVSYRLCVLTDLTRAAQSGSTVPITVQICGPNGTPMGNSATVVVHAVSVDNASAIAAGKSQPGNNFRYDATSGGSYQYNLKTTGLASGSHQFTFTIGGDPVPQVLTILIK